jgi:hypothetical protein
MNSPRSNFALRRSASTGTIASAAQRRRMLPPASAIANITWNSGERLGSRVTPKHLHQLLKRHVLVRIRLQRRGPHPPEVRPGSSAHP